MSDLVESKSYNPNITDREDPRFTELGNLDNHWLATSAIQDDAYYGNDYEKVEVVQRLSLGEISEGDFVVLGNRAGMVTSVLTDSTGSDLDIIGIVVNEDLRYLPADYKSDPALYGYDDDDSKRNRTTTYVFGKDTSEEGIRTGSGVPQIFQGTLKLLRKNTEDSSSWNKIAQAVVAYQDKFVTP